MTSNNPCAVYNFYNCCNGNSSSHTQSAPFIWQSGNILETASSSSTATFAPLVPNLSFRNSPNADLKAYLGLLPLHRKAQLQEIMLLRFADQTPIPPIPPTVSPYTATINLDLVVLDYSGVVKRQISTVQLDYRAIPLMTWTPISLSQEASDLDIMPGELIAGQTTFGAALTPSTYYFSTLYQLSGTGVLL